MIACGATMSTDFAIYLCVISWNVASIILCRNYLQSFGIDGSTLLGMMLTG